MAMPGWRGVALMALLLLAAVAAVAGHGAGEQEWLTQGFTTMKDSHDHHHDHTHQHAHTHEHSFQGAPLSRTGKTSEVWLYGLASSLVVSCAALVCLAAIPFLTRKGVVSEDAASVMTAFGAGAMLGDAFLHQLPHAFNKGSHNHDHDHDHNPSAPVHAHSLADLSVGLSILAGLLLFFLVEVAVRAGSTNGHAHHHHHHGGHLMTEERGGEGVKGGEGPEGLRRRKEGGERKEGEKVGSEGREGGQGQDRVGMRTLGYLNLFADGVHNFTDGMALGAAFSSRGFAAGWGKTLFMIAHELPQEIGDYGILLRAGFGVMKALLLNFMSALLALFGTAFAIIVGGGNNTHTHIIDASLLEGFTAGGFMYIALAGVVPDIHANRTSTGMQLVAVLAGMGVALWISTVE
eukprot:jgi/Chlat1/3323/Chrsp22S03481